MPKTRDAFSLGFRMLREKLRQSWRRVYRRLTTSPHDRIHRTEVLIPRQEALRHRNRVHHTNDMFHNVGHAGNVDTEAGVNLQRDERAWAFLVLPAAVCVPMTAFIYYLTAPDRREQLAQAVADQQWRESQSAQAEAEAAEALSKLKDAVAEEMIVAKAVASERARSQALAEELAAKARSLGLISTVTDNIAIDAEEVMDDAGTALEDEAAMLIPVSLRSKGVEPSRFD